MDTDTEHGCESSEGRYTFLRGQKFLYITEISRQVCKMSIRPTGPFLHNPGCSSTRRLVVTVNLPIVTV